MNNLHQVANRRLSSASSAAPHFLQQKTPAFAAPFFLFPFVMAVPVAAAERLLLAVRHLFSF
ncbi:MAG: hypothetical protein WBD81_03085 [Collimonas pratensis]|uniref:hypothetical protein n=1 Tax=Collimonas pratensis TaxID=279113 RepID=UPI003C79107C